MQHPTQQAEKLQGAAHASIITGRDKVKTRWPAGTKLSDDGRAVVGESGKRIEFGSEVGLGCGFKCVPLPAECDGARWSGTYDV